MKKATLLLIFFLPVMSLAQTEVWADLNLYKKVTEKFTVYGDAGPRLNVEGNTSNGFYIRPSFSYQVSKFMFGGGIAWFYANANDIHAHEIRGWQGVRYEQRLLKQLLVNNYTRLEERSTTAEGETKFVLRFRTLFGVTVLLNHETFIKNTWYTSFAFEVFEDLNDHESFINRYRVYSGLGYAVNDKTRIEIFYIANEARTTKEAEFKNVNVIRLRIHITIPEQPPLVD